MRTKISGFLRDPGAREQLGSVRELQLGLRVLSILAGFKDSPRDGGSKSVAL